MEALAVETQENWLEARSHFNMEDLKEHKKDQLREAALRACLASPMFKAISEKA
ncbi:hypothetical protein [Microvirga sp. VF16]|uniref:hypothetical protein n=1 Tax=Microvirga sp. VF16 TaxID=2807101 RepID=UPI00193E50AB|nr:hypothetical protein [Microvirga sp. VF16]QRM33221.1 hypothetical protein JO965_28505 [Microvirga sp. VF16]